MEITRQFHFPQVETLRYSEKQRGRTSTFCVLGSVDTQPGLVQGTSCRLQASENLQTPSGCAKEKRVCEACFLVPGTQNQEQLAMGTPVQPASDGGCF